MSGAILHPKSRRTLLCVGVAAVLLAVVMAIGIFLFTRTTDRPRKRNPLLVEVIVQYPGASAEEVERQVTIPLEVSLSGMPGLKTTRSKSAFGLAVVHAYMVHVQDNAEASVRRVIGALKSGRFELPLDNGAVIKLAIIASVLPQVTVMCVSGSSSRPMNRVCFRAKASRNRRAPDVSEYWWKPSLRARWAAATRSDGGSKSGKPCARLMAS